MEQLVLLAAAVGATLLGIVAVLLIFERDSDQQSRFVIDGGRIRLRSTIEREQAEAEHQELRALVREDAHPDPEPWRDEPDWNWPPRDGGGRFV